jgi:hypothetical protein
MSATRERVRPIDARTLAIELALAGIERELERRLAPCERITVWRALEWLAAEVKGERRPVRPWL